MRYRKLGNTDLELPEVGFGVWTLSTSGWPRLDERDSLSLLNRATELGITFFDTADVYGEGYGEEILAKALGRRRSNIIIGTKVGYDFYSHEEIPGQEGLTQDFSPRFVRNACEQSLRRLKTDCIDLYQLHHPPMEAIESDDLFETLEALVREGKIRCYGCALGADSDWTEEVEEVTEERRLSSIQLAHNVLEQEQARKLLPIASKEGTGLVARNPHASGVLDGSYNSTQAGLDSDLRKVKLLDFLTGETDATLGQVAIKFALAHKSIISVLPNITNPEKLREFALAPDTPDLSKESLARIDDLYENGFSEPG